QSLHSENAERAARLPACLVTPGCVELFSLDVHAIGLALQGGGRPESGNAPKLGGRRVPLAEIHRMDELMRENFRCQQVAGIAAEMVARRVASKELIGEVDRS